MLHKKSLFFVFSAMVLLAGFAGPTYGLEKEDPFAKVPNKSLADDSNRDGVVSREEWLGSAEDFTRLDANEDNVLSPRELESYVQIGIDRFAEWDVNRDGILSRSEWQDREHFFHKLDRNKDGVLTRNEFYFE